ncbi:hypothetical protein ACIQZB_44765 [Streptomyces sp. NPDC097727]|uniref:hypothetical protein n=1 Tax=Streptomyces sp. NPDC097727 TaxID=3366092 RepID=UPI003805AFC3
MVGKADIPLTSAPLSFWGVGVGRDLVSRVSQAYDDDFPFPPQELEAVPIEFLSAPSLDEVAEAIETKE